MKSSRSVVREQGGLPPPIFVLAGPSSHGALIGAMIGCNPAACALPELNLFVADTLEGACLEMARHGRNEMHGLLRTVAQAAGGEQSLASISMARRWVIRRMPWPTRRVFEEICSRAAPFRVVEKSRAHLRHPEHLKRISEACPDAYYVHIARSAGPAVEPPGQGAPDAHASSGGEPTSDTERLSREVDERIGAFLKAVRPDRQVHVVAEELFSEPQAQLASLCTALGLPADESSLSAMLNPETSPFARIGPAGAAFGDDPAFLRNPYFRASPTGEGTEPPSSPLAEKAA